MMPPPPMKPRRKRPVESPAEPQAEQTPEEPAPEVVVSDHEPVAEEADFAE